MAGEWNAVVAEVKGYEAELREQRPGMDSMADHVGYAAWRKGAALKLPAGVLVWLDEFLREREADRKRLHSDDMPVTLAPMLDGDTRAAVLEGFEDCPRRGLDADLATIGYADFVAICHVDEPKNFGGFRLGANGLYVDLPDDGATLTPEERAAVTWHPTGQYDKPALPLPCTLGQLRAFLPHAGMTGCIDEEAVDELLGEREQHHVGWYGATIDADMWWSLSSTRAREAAMLLSQFNPHDDTCDPLTTTNDETGPDDYKRLLRVFEDLENNDPQARTLRQWYAIARDKGLKHHSWIAKYATARFAGTPIEPGSAGGSQKVDDGGTARDKPKRVGAITTHRLKSRSNPLDAIIELATGKAVAPGDSQSVYAEMVKLAELTDKPAPLHGYSPDGIQYRGKKYEETGEPDTFTAKNLRDRMARAKAR